MDNERTDQGQGGKRALVIVVTVLLLLILAAAVWQGRNKQAGIEQEPVRMQVAQVALSMIQADLSSLVAPTDGKSCGFFVGQNVAIDRKAADRMAFSAWTLHRTAQGEIRRREALVEYRLKTDPDVPGHFLMRREVLPVDAGMKKRDNDFSLAGQVESLNIQYTDDAGKTTDNWTGQDGQQTKPAQVEVRLTLLGAAGKSEKYVAVLKPSKFQPGK